MIKLLLLLSIVIICLLLLRLFLLISLSLRYSVFQFSLHIVLCNTMIITEYYKISVILSYNRFVFVKSKLKNIGYK